MIINSLFLQNTEASGEAMNALGMQKPNSAGYLFSDIIKVHLGNEDTADAGLSQTITGESGLSSISDVSSLMALIQNLTANGELSDELKQLLEGNTLIGETTVTEEQLENILASLINQPNTIIYGVNPVSEEPVILSSLEGIKSYLAENGELLISSEDGNKSLKIDLSQMELNSKTADVQGNEKAANVFSINGKEKAEGNEKSFKVIFNYQTTKTPEAEVDETSDFLQSMKELKKETGDGSGKVLSEAQKESADKQVVSEGEKSAKIIDINKAGKTEDSEKGKQNQTSQLSSEKAGETQTKNVKTELTGDNAKAEAKTEEELSDQLKVNSKTKGEQSEGGKTNLTSDKEGKNSFNTSKDGEAEVKGQKELNSKSEKVKPEAKKVVKEDAEIKVETEVKKESVNVSAKKNVKSENLNINGKTIVTQPEVKAETKTDVNPAANSQSNSDIANSLKSDTDTTEFNFSDNSKSNFTNLKNSGHEAHTSTKFSDMINEKINKEQFLVKPEATKIVRAAELVKEISKYIQTQDKNSLTIHLDPEHLGKVKIMMEVTDKVVKAHIEVDNEVAKHMVETNIKDLQNSSQKQGLQLGQVNISLSNTEQKNHKQFADKDKKSDENSQKLMDDDFIDEEVQQIKNLGYNTVEYVA